MKKFLILLTLAGLFACTPSGHESFQYYNLYGFVDVVGPTTLSLEFPAVTLNVTEDRTDSGWARQQTVFFQYDILNRTANDRYDIRVIAYYPVERKLVRPKSAVSAEEYGSDAVAFHEDWGFNREKRTFNVSCYITTLKDSETQHTITLVADEARSNADTLYLELHHQGFGETYENEAYEPKDFIVENRFLRFDLGSVFPVNARKDLVLTLEWDWFPTENGALVRQREHFQASADLGELSE